MKRAWVSPLFVDQGPSDNFPIVILLRCALRSPVLCQVRGTDHWDINDFLLHVGSQCVGSLGCHDSR